LQFSVFGALFALAAVLLAGCGIFDPEKNPVPPPEPPAEYVIPSQPGYVLNNLEIAYSHRDSTAYKEVYDSTYVGSSLDQSDTNPETISFTYSEEVAHIAALARSPTISSVTFDVGPATSWNRLTSDDPSHPEWAVIQIAGTSLDVQVTDGRDTWQASGLKEYFQFSFAPTTPAPSSPSDTLWKIVRWVETRSP